MATKRKPAVGSVPATAYSEFITRSCDAFALRSTTPKQRARIAAVAYDLWLARSFRHGSPQEDWLKALLRAQRRRQPSVRRSAISSSPNNERESQQSPTIYGWPEASEVDRRRRTG
jgi:hypothetical protein